MDMVVETAIEELLRMFPGITINKEKLTFTSLGKKKPLAKLVTRGNKKYLSMSTRNQARAIEYVNFINNMQKSEKTRRSHSQRVKSCS